VNQPTARNRWLRIARAVYLLVLAALLARVLVTNRDQLADLLRVERPWLLGIALLTGFGQLALNASFWTRALAATGQRIGWWPVLRVMARSLPARYVPGSVWYAASRVGMLRAAGVSMRALGVTALLETVLTVIVSMSVGAVLLGVAGQLPGDRLSSVAWTLALAVLVSPPVLNRLLGWISRRRATPGGAPRLTWADYRALVGWMVVYWLLSAVTFTLYLLAFGLDLAGPLVIAGTFLVAWVIGFLTPIAPQGAGAFEVVFVALLAPPAAGAAIVIVAGFRALIGIRDALAFAWATWRGRLDAPVTAPGDDPARPAPR
jgi:glycosyltransferase 2 family protein